MILEQNYRKVAQYTQKAFKLYSRRYFANLMLQILQKRQNIRQVQKIPIQANRASNFSQNFSQKESDLIAQSSEVEKQIDNVYSKTMKNIGIFEGVDKQNMFTDISYLKYGDIVFIQIYNSGMNSSDKSQRLRVFSQLQTLKYKRLSYLSNDVLTQKRCAFQIVNPYDFKSKQQLNGNKIFCLKSLFCNKFICSTSKVKLSQFFGYEISMSKNIVKQCFFQFKAIQSKSKKILAYQPIGIKISEKYLRAQGLQVSTNLQGSVFYFCKVSCQRKDLQPQFVIIKNVALQKYLSSSQIELSKLTNKKTYTNVSIQDENGFPIKQNQLVFSTLDFNKSTESQITFDTYNQQSIKQIWILNPVQKNGCLDPDEIEIIHACSNRGIAVKVGKMLKLMSNQNQISCFNLTRHIQNVSGNQDAFDQNEQKSKKSMSYFSGLNSPERQNGYASSLKSFELSYQQSNVMVIKSRQQFDKHYLGLYEAHSMGHYKLEENKKILFQIHKINHNQSQLIQQLMEIQSILKSSYEFVEKIGFILDQSTESLRFSVQEVKKYNLMIISHLKTIKLILNKIHLFLQNKYESQIPLKKVQTIVKQLKIFQILISLTKIINLKIGKKRHFSQEQNFKIKLNLNSDELKNKTAQTPFQLCQKYFQPLLLNIFETIYKLTANNQKCSNGIIQQANFFNKLLMSYPQKIGRILQQAIKNLSLFTTKASNNDCGQLFQWAKLIENLNNQNILVQKTYVDIIAEVVVDPYDKGIIPYQNKCRQLLFNQRNKKKIMPRFGVYQNRTIITFQSSNLAQFISSNQNLTSFEICSQQNASFFIDDFFTQQYQTQQKTLKNQEYIEFIISLLKLIRNLCKDRNKRLLKVAQDYGLDQYHINCCLKSNKIGWRLKMQYLLLYSAIYIDQDPFLKFQRRQSKCYVWSKINQYNLQNKTALIFKQYTDASAASQKFKQFDLNIIPFLESYAFYSKKNLQMLFNSILNQSIYQFQKQIKEQLSSFQIMLKFTFQTINFGYFNIYYIKKFVIFIISYYNQFCALVKSMQVFQFRLRFQSLANEVENLFSKKKNQILNEMLNIIELNQNIWRDLNCLNLLKIFCKSYSQNKQPLTALQLRDHCWKLLNNQIPILMIEQVSLIGNKNLNIAQKKKTTCKNMFQEDYSGIIPLEQKTNPQYDNQIGIFLLQIIITHTQISHKTSYKKLIHLVSRREKRNLQIFEELNSLLILNGKKQELLYRDYSGRVTGKILNVIKIYQLMIKIKGSEYENIGDVEDQKRKKEKVVELNNLISKIRRQMAQIKEEDTVLFKKLQQIIQKLDIDLILMDLLNFSTRPTYQECISNLYKFYIQFIWQNQANKVKLSKYFNFFMSNLKIQKSPILLSQLYLALEYKQKRKYVQQLFEKLHSTPLGQESPIKQSVLQTLYRIIKKTKQKQLLGQIKSQFTFQIFKQNDYTSLLSLGTNLSAQYVNVLCELGSKCSYVFQKIRQIYPKTMLRKIIYQQHRYSQRSVLLKLFYYFYIKNNQNLENYEIEDILENFIFPEIKHLPSVCQYLALQNLQLKQNQLLNAQKQQKQKMQRYNLKKDQQSYLAEEDKSNVVQGNDENEEIAHLKKKFEDLILYEQNPIEPSEQQKYWNFIYNTEDQSQMSLINFTILLFKIQSKENPQKVSISKKISKSPTYQSFIKYLNQLCQFLKGAFSKNSNQYQRKIVNKLEEILIIYEQKHDLRQKTLYLNISESDKLFLAEFFDELSKIIIKESISYIQIIRCAQVSNSDFNRRRAGQNVQKMILEEQFINFIQKIAKNIQNIKQFNLRVTEKKLSKFFNIYRSNKVRKINVFKFLQKLFEYLQSIKNKKINEHNQIYQIIQKQNNGIDQKAKSLKGQYNNFVDQINQNNVIQTHFKAYIKKYETTLKLLLLSRWTNKNEQLLQIVFQKLSKQNFPYDIKRFKKNDRTSKMLKNLQIQSQSGNQYLSSKPILRFYLKFWCSGNNKTAHKMKNWNVTDETVDQYEHRFTNNILQIHSRFYKDSLCFSRIILWILKQINKNESLLIVLTQNMISKYLNQKLQQTSLQPSNTINKIIYQLIINFNKKSRCSSNQNTQNFIYQNFTTISQIKRNQPQQQNETEQSRRKLNFANLIYDQLLKYIDSEADQLLNFNFNYELSSRLEGNKHFDTFLPQIIKQKIQIIKYGLKNKLIHPKYFSKLDFFFFKIISIWTKVNYPFSDLNWCEILSAIIDLLDKYVNDIKGFADLIARNQQYISRFTLLVEHCSNIRLKTSNVSSLVEIRLFTTLNQFHMKIYLENHKELVASLTNSLNFRLLANSIKIIYEESIEPKLGNYQNEIWCENKLQKCSFQVCNDQKITENDQSIMEIFVSSLILIQLSITLHNHGYFKRNLRHGDSEVLQTFQKALKISKHETRSSENSQINYLYFYKRFIGIVYLYSEEGSLVTFHFKIPYLQKYCTKEIQNQLLHYFKRLEQQQVGKHLELFSKYFQAQIQAKKSHERIPLLSTILNYKNEIQNFIILIAVAHAILLIVPGWHIPDLYYYPLTTAFVLLKIIFAITQFSKAQNIIRFIYEEKQLTFKEKKVFLNIFLAILYLVTFFIPELFGVAAVGQTYNLRYCHKISKLMLNAFIHNILFLAVCLGLIAILFGILLNPTAINQPPSFIISQAFREFYTFLISSLKVTTQNQFIISKEFPVSFIIYATLIVIFIYRTFSFFLSQLKLQKDQKNNVEQSCVICLRKNTDFEKQGSSFQEHIQSKHNLWHYLYFFIYLRRKANTNQKSTLKSIEAYIRQSIQNKKCDFINAKSSIYNQ